MSEPRKYDPTKGEFAAEMLERKEKRKSPPALQILVDKHITAEPLTGGKPIKVKVRRAWHRMGAPREVCIETYDHEGIYVAEAMRAISEAMGLDAQETEVFTDLFRQATRHIAGSKGQVWVNRKLDPIQK